MCPSLCRHHKYRVRHLPGYLSLVRNFCMTKYLCFKPAFRSLVAGQFSAAPNYKLFFNNFHFIPPPSLFTCKPIKCSYKYLLSPHTQKLGGHFENSFLTRHLMPTPIYMLLCFVLFPFSTFVLNYVVKYRKRTDFLQTRLPTPVL